MFVDLTLKFETSLDSLFQILYISLSCLYPLLKSQILLLNLIELIFKLILLLTIAHMMFKL